jgi:hypothetical protein
MGFGHSNRQGIGSNSAAAWLVASVSKVGGQNRIQHHAKKNGLPIQSILILKHLYSRKVNNNYNQVAVPVSTPSPPTTNDPTSVSQASTIPSQASTGGFLIPDINFLDEL